MASKGRDYKGLSGSPFRDLYWGLRVLGGLGVGVRASGFRVLGFWGLGVRK